MRKLFTVIAVLAFGLIALFLFELGVERQEKAECLKFQDYAREFSDFFLTQFQKDQCDNYGIFVNAPVNKLPRM